jgi:hypothetical protein
VKPKWLLTLVLGLAGVAVCGGIALATPPSGVTNPPWSPVVGTFAGGIDAKAKPATNARNTTDLWQIRITAKGWTDVHILENIIAPGGTFGWHSHPGPSLVIVKSGTLSVYHTPDCKPNDYGPLTPNGTAFVDKDTTSTWSATTAPPTQQTSTSSRSSRQASAGESTRPTQTRAICPN